MRKTIIAAICGVMLLTATLMTSVRSQMMQQPKPFVAVFCSQEFEWVWVEKHQPDKLEVADEGWSEFEKFCKDVKKEANGRPIVIDLMVHGNDSGLAVTVPPFAQVTSMGYVVNTIEKNVGTKNITVLLEACFSGSAYYYTIRNQDRAKPLLNHAGVPAFPIYGVGSGFSNYGNTVYLQWLYGSQGYFEDLRNYEYKKPLIHEIEDSQGISPSARALMMIFFKLYSL